MQSSNEIDHQRMVHWLLGTKIEDKRCEPKAGGHQMKPKATNYYVGKTM